MDEISFGSELRRLRALSGRTQRSVAGLVGHVTASVSNWERELCVPSLDVARALDEALGGRGGLVALWEDGKRAGGVPAHLRDDVTLLSRSRAVEVVTPALVPGLLQEPTYARHVIAAARPTDPPSAVADRVAARCRVLDTVGGDVRITAVFPRAALECVPATVAQAQAAHLVDLVDTGRVTVHLVGPPGLVGVGGPFSVYRLQDGGQAATTDHAVGSVVVGPSDVAFLLDVARAALGDADSSTVSTLHLKEKAK